MPWKPSGITGADQNHIKRIKMSEFYELKDGDRVYSTGVFLIRDAAAPGGWRVDGFEDDTYYNGVTVNSIQSNETVSFYTGLHPDELK
jgi:hypothetical protein